jgi:hypothetical protein
VDEEEEVEVGVPMAWASPSRSVRKCHISRRLKGGSGGKYYYFKLS